MSLRILRLVLILIIGCLLFAGCISIKTLTVSSNGDISDLPASSMASASIPDAGKIKIQKVINALFAAGMVGDTWNKAEDEAHKDDQSFLWFYCMMNPDYPSKIPAPTFEPFIQQHFNVSTNFLQQMVEYNASENNYEVPPDIFLDMASSQIEEFLRIDAMSQEKDETTVSFRIIWGNMAESGDGNNTAFAGNVLLEKVNDIYRVQSVEVTENHADKYD